MIYPIQADINENADSTDGILAYSPSAKHDKNGWGSNNPISTLEEGQLLLDSGYHDGKQVYNITKNKVIVKFQPDNTPNNGFHSYEVSKPRDIPPRILKKMLEDGKLTRSEYNAIRKGKK